MNKLPSFPFASVPAITVLGAGAWGTALACAFAQRGAPVWLWGRDPGRMAALADTRQHPALPGVILPAEVLPITDLDAACTASVVLAVVPTGSLRALAGLVALRLPAGVPLIAGAKGIERSTKLFVTSVLAEACPQARPAILSGPGFARDVARGLPTALTIAASDEALALTLAGQLAAPSLRLYHATDVRGVEIGGAAKNVLAIACGIVAGRGLGASAAAALIARGFAEIVRFGEAMGAQASTLMGLSGLGDLVLTCGSAQSRNYAFGEALGRGETPPGSLAEGALTAPVLVDMARAAGVDMPVATAVADVLAGKLTIDAAIDALMARPQKAER
jgi:glycerol-3-phosphate dehydrogenase (NAD(P)+)